MSSGCGLSSSHSIYGGLCSSNSRRPSMFTAKYRLREERKKVLKLSLNKVKRIEDPESFLRRSVLINNTIKRLQREVREEKMIRSGGYTSKLHSMHSSFRKSFASSRLSEMHLSASDELMDDPSPFSSSSHNLFISSSTDSSSRKRAHSEDSEDDCDVHAVLSSMYVPPTPCIISCLEEDDCCDSTTLPSPKKPRLDNLVSSSDLASSPSNTMVVDELDVDIDVDVVGDGEPSDWPILPSPLTLLQPDSGLCDTTVEVEDVINEFTLDLHLSSSPRTCKEADRIPASELEDAVSSGSEDEELKASSDSKENTCEVPAVLSAPASSSPSSTDLSLQATKCSNHNNNVVMINSNPSAGSGPESGDKTASQYSSCGHSSIFGELQSVVFHSLIASLET